MTTIELTGLLVGIPLFILSLICAGLYEIRQHRIQFELSERQRIAPIPLTKCAGGCGNLVDARFGLCPSCAWLSITMGG